MYPDVCVPTEKSSMPVVFGNLLAVLIHDGLFRSDMVLFSELSCNDDRSRLYSRDRVNVPHCVAVQSYAEWVMSFLL